jgi:hypothetical protein
MSSQSRFRIGDGNERILALMDSDIAHIRNICWKSQRKFFIKSDRRKTYPRIPRLTAVLIVEDSVLGSSGWCSFARR